MTDQPIKIDTAPSGARPKKRWRWLYGAAALAMLCYLASLFAVFPSFNRHPDRPEAMAPEPGSPLPEAENEVQMDESQLQWISPTSGPPITLEYVPLGTQVLLHLRPAELVAHSEGEKILAALSPWGRQAEAHIEEFTGAKLSEIESLLVALIRVDDRWDFALRAAFKEPRTLAPPDAKGRTAFLPAAGQGRVLVSCPIALGRELKEQGDKPALLARDLERLLPFSDQHRSATLLIPTKFLDTGGRELFTDNSEKLIDSFESLVPDNASAVLVSCDWRENFFCELAATIVQNAPAHRFNAEFKANLVSAANQLISSLEMNPPQAYGKDVEDRFPAMLGAMSGHTRVSHDRGIALARCYLPVQAGHNLLLASRLRMNTTAQVTESTAADLSLAERLRQTTSLSFPKETLENALEILAADANLPIQIAGRDLQLEGITRNQTFELDLHNRPVAEILVEVLRQANPDREATGPEDLRQKLVYVIRADAIIVTTRAAVAQRGEELPEVFRGVTR